MNESKEEFVKPVIRISAYAHEALLNEMNNRKAINLSSLLEMVAADFELKNRKG